MIYWLKEKKEFTFPVYEPKTIDDYNKGLKNRLIIKYEICFIACEEEILEMSDIIAENEYDAYDEDSLQIAIALYNAGYRRVND